MLRRLVLPVAILLVASPRAPRAQLIRIQAGRGELATEVRADRRGYPGARDLRESSFREWIRIPLQGGLPSPQLFSWSAVFRPLIGQQSGTGLPQRYATRATGTDVAVSMLQSRFGGLNLFSTRQVGSAEGGLGGESFYDTRARGLTARLVTRFIPMTVDLNERRTADTWRGAFHDIPFERRERVRVARLAAAGSKTTVLLDQMNFDDYKGVTSFHTANAMATHRARWGRGSTLESTIEHADRTGYDPYRRGAWSERLQLYHTDAVMTHWGVHARSSTTYGIPSTGTGLSAQARVNVSRATTATLGIDRSSSRFPAGSSHAMSIAPRLAWRRTLARRSWLNGSVGARAEDVTRRLAGGDYAAVDEERHRIEPSRTLQLERVNADGGSVIVRSTDQSRTYREPEDYRVLVLGPVVRLQFPAGSRIATGDIIVVTYRYLLLQRSPYRVLGVAAEASAGSPWLHGRYSIASRDVSSRDGSPVISPEQGIDEVAGVGIATTIGRGSLEFDLEARRRARSVADYSVREARLTFLPPARGRLTTSLGGTITRTADDGERIGASSANVAVAWMPNADLRFQGGVDAWRWQLSDSRPDQFLGVSALLGWRLGALETEWRYAYQLRDQAVRGAEHRMWGRLIRHF